MLPTYTILAQKNVYDQTGEVKLRLGQHQMAKQYFTRALQLDSDNQLAAKRIEKLLQLSLN
jgi:Tfp pilus assembly protein PilF